jgi:predicted alpha/beta-hydrolase family hydrolase
MNAHEELLPTPVGTARITWYPARDTARAVALLGHGSATGVEAADLQALADALPRRGVTVALVTQPYRLAANRRAADEASLDAAWTALVIQGGGDPFGRPDQFPALPPEIELVEIPSANHTFGTGNGTPRAASMDRVTTAATEWIERQHLAPDTAARG